MTFVAGGSTSQTIEHGLAIAHRLEKGLKTAVEEALERSRLTGVETLASAAISMDNADLRSFFERSKRGSRYYWETADEGLAMAGDGVAMSCDIDQEDQFEAGREFLIKVAAAGVAPNGHEPIAFSTFAFDPANFHDPVWTGLPPGRMVIPEISLIDRDGRQTLLLNVLVGEEPEDCWIAKIVDRALGLVNVDGTGPTVTDPQVAESRLARPGNDVWNELVARVLGSIEAGEIEKLVLARRLELSLREPVQPAYVIDTLRSRYPEAAVVASEFLDALFVAATPERLVRVRHGKAEMTCLAGSAARSRNEAEDAACAELLLSSDKDLREHEFVVGFCEARLRPLSVRVTRKGPRLLTLRNVHHLATDLTSTLRPGVTLLDVASRIHPSPAVAGVPQERVLDMIRDLEPFSRGWYAGAVGWMTPSGEGDLFLSLRSALVRGTRAYLFAGCGLVAGSEAGAEWSETEAKLAPMLSAVTGQ